MTFNIALGEFRGEFMANKRRQAFKLAFGREPNFTSNFHPKSNLPIDFIEAKLLVDEEELYLNFISIAKEAIEHLCLTQKKDYDADRLR